MSTQTTERERDEAIATAIECRNVLLRYVALMGVGIVAFILSFGTLTNDPLLVFIEIEPFPVIVRIVAGILAAGGFLGASVQSYRLWNFMDLTR